MDTKMSDILTPTLFRERLDDGRIVVFTLHDMANDTVNHWIAACLEEMKRCEEEHRPILILQDLSHPAVCQTEYSRERGQEVTTACPDLPGRIAFILQPGSVTTTRIGRFVRGQQLHCRDRQVFFSRDEALDWLRSPL